MNPQRVFAFYSSLGGAELARLEAFGQRISILAPNWYAADLAGGTVSERAPDAQVMRLSRQDGFAVWPVINAQTAGSPAIADGVSADSAGAR